MRPFQGDYDYEQRIKRNYMKKVTIKHILAKTASPVKYADARSYRPEQAATTEITALIVFPACIWILVSRGDREADCGGIMDPVGVWVRKKMENGQSYTAAGDVDI